MRAALVVLAGVLLVGCGGSASMRASLADVGLRDAFWEIRSTCSGGSFSVRFEPGERIALSGLAEVSYEQIEVGCGTPERVAVGSEAGAPAAADLTAPTRAATTLACRADGTLVVSANPVWGERAVVGSALMVRRGGDAVLSGVLKKSEPDGSDWSRLAWSRSLCRPD